jgi:hypothetical protein
LIIGKILDDINDKHLIIGSILEDINDKYLITGSILEDVIDKYLIIGSILDVANDPKILFRQSSLTFSILLPVFIAVTRNTFPVWHFWISIIVICTLVAPGSSIFIITFTNWLIVNFVKVAMVSKRMSRGFGVWTGTSLARYVIWWRGGTIKTFPTNKEWVLKDHTGFFTIMNTKNNNLDKRYYDEMTIFYH